MSGGFYLRYALRALQRGGQRTLLALLCLAFGVMSLVAMQLLAGMVTAGLLSDPRAILGGDARIRTGEDQSFSAAQIGQLDQLRATGQVQTYTLVAEHYTPMLKPANGSGVHFLLSPTRAVDPATYPLIGTIPLRAPAGGTFAGAITRPLGAVLTHDLADELHLQVGDHFTLLGRPGTATVPLTVAGIAQDVPDRQGERVYYSLDTESQLTGGIPNANSASILWGPGGPAPTPLSTVGGPVEVATSNTHKAGVSDNVASVFSFMLKAAGILGLIVGGIGVANTLQVTLARRTLEIATLKTLGYRRGDLLTLFGVETALLGLAGGLIGAAAGIGLASILVTLLGRTAIFLLPWVVDPATVVAGVLTGALTAVIFGLYTIVQASSVRPAVLLRQLPVPRGWRTRFAGLALLGGLVVLFSAISSMVMGSPLEGIEVIGGAIAGLIALALLLSGAMFVLLRIPSPRLPLLTLARQNLKRQTLRAIFPLIALFMGIFTIGFATGTITDAFNRVSTSQLGSGTGANLAVYGRQADRAAIMGQLATAGVADMHISTQVSTRVETGTGQALPSLTYLEGRTAPDMAWNLHITDGQWTGAGDTVLVPAALAGALHIGDSLWARPSAGPPMSLRIAGFYTAQQESDPFLDRIGPPRGLLLSQETALRLGGPGAGLVVVGTLPAARLAVAAATLDSALPQAAIVSRADFLTAFGQFRVNLLYF